MNAKDVQHKQEEELLHHEPTTTYPTINFVQIETNENRLSLKNCSAKLQRDMQGCFN